VVRRSVAFAAEDLETSPAGDEDSVCAGHSLRATTMDRHGPVDEVSVDETGSREPEPHTALDNAKPVRHFFSLSSSELVPRSRTNLTPSL
jgi:hypothetical protein